MPVWLIPFLLEFLPQIPQLVRDGENIFSGHPTDKVSGALTGAATLLQHAASALAPVDQAMTQPQNVAQPEAPPAVNPAEAETPPAGTPTPEGTTSGGELHING